MDAFAIVVFEFERRQDKNRATQGEKQNRKPHASNDRRGVREKKWKAVHITVWVYATHDTLPTGTYWQSVASSSSS